MRAKFEKARSILTATPGLDMSQAEQKVYYQTLLQIYHDEHSLLSSYKEICKFDMSKLQEIGDIECSVTDDKKTSVTQIDKKSS